MARQSRVEATESFHQRIEKLRIKIDSLPEAQRPHLYELAEAIAQQHRQLQNRVSQNDDAR